MIRYAKWCTSRLFFIDVFFELWIYIVHNNQFSSSILSLNHRWNYAMDE